MPRKIKSVRRKKLHTWAKRFKQKGGFIFSLAALGAAIAAAASAAAPAIATGAVTAASGYAATKILQQVGGAKRRTIRRR
jgi:hypothetical protein